MKAFKKSGDPADLPAPSIVEHVARGEYGQKTGKGWYDYSNKTSRFQYAIKLNS